MLTEILFHPTTRKLFVNIKACDEREATLLQAFNEQGRDLVIDGAALSMGSKGGWICLCTKGAEIHGTARDRAESALARVAQVRGTDLVLCDREHAQRFVGVEYIEAAPRETSDVARRSGRGRVSAINHTTGVVTLDDAYSIVGLVDGDYLFTQEPTR